MSLRYIEKPQPLLQKIIKTISIIFFICILIISFKKTEINFFKLFEKRQNAYSYLFGKKLTEEDHQDAKRQASMYPQLMSHEEAKRLIREKYQVQSPKRNRPNDHIHL